MPKQVNGQSLLNRQLRKPPPKSKDALCLAHARNAANGAINGHATGLLQYQTE
jgi:hypothetical protein